jgi:hypothetical protein
MIDGARVRPRTANYVWQTVNRIGPETVNSGAPE